MSYIMVTAIHILLYKKKNIVWPFAMWLKCLLWEGYANQPTNHGRGHLTYFSQWKVCGNATSTRSRRGIAHSHQSLLLAWARREPHVSGRVCPPTWIQNEQTCGDSQSRLTRRPAATPQAGAESWQEINVVVTYWNLRLFVTTKAD